MFPGLLNRLREVAARRGDCYAAPMMQCSMEGKR